MLDKNDGDYNQLPPVGDEAAYSFPHTQLAHDIIGPDGYWSRKPFIAERGRYSAEHNRQIGEVINTGEMDPAYWSQFVCADVVASIKQYDKILCYTNAMCRKVNVIKRGHGPLLDGEPVLSNVRLVIGDSTYGKNTQFKVEKVKKTELKIKGTWLRTEGGRLASFSELPDSSLCVAS